MAMLRTFVAAVVGIALVSWALDAYAYEAPKRSTVQVAYAIGISNPGIAKARREALARWVIAAAEQHNFDPLSAWAIIDHESGWRSDAVSRDGFDIGLAQIRYVLRPPCVEDPESEACSQVRERLFDPATNIRVMAASITAWRALCTEKIGRAPDMQHWLAGYGGYSRPRQGIYCGHQRVEQGGRVIWKPLPTPAPVQDILDARHRMIARLRADRIE